MLDDDLNPPEVPRYHYIGLSIKEDKASKLYSALIEDYINTKDKITELELRIHKRDRLLELMGVNNIDDDREWSRHWNDVQAFVRRMKYEEEKNNRAH